MLGNNEILGLLDGIRINKTNKVAIYTALTNTYDQIYAPKVNPSNLDYYLFTDNIRDLETNIWNVKKINFQYRDPRRLAKLFKIFPHHLFPNYDYSIWVDASIEILNDLNDLINEYLKNNEDFISFFKHPKRTCIYEEKKYLVSLGYDNKTVLEKQVNRYRDIGYPSQNGLIAGGVIIRKHNHRDCKIMMYNWWKEIDQYSSRDQLSFNFICWKNNHKYVVINMNQHDNYYFIIHPHPRLMFYDDKGSVIINFHVLKSTMMHIITSTKIYRKYLRKIYLFLKSKIL